MIFIFKICVIKRKCSTSDIRSVLSAANVNNESRVSPVSSNLKQKKLFFYLLFLCLCLYVYRSLFHFISYLFIIFFTIVIVFFVL